MGHPKEPLSSLFRVLRLKALADRPSLQFCRRKQDVSARPCDCHAVSVARLSEVRHSVLQRLCGGIHFRIGAEREYALSESDGRSEHKRHAGGYDGGSEVGHAALPWLERENATTLDLQPLPGLVSCLTACERVFSRSGRFRRARRAVPAGRAVSACSGHPTAHGQGPGASP